MKEKVKEILRGHVNRHEYPVNPEEIYAGVLKELNKKKKKKRYFIGLIFFFGISIFLKFQFSNLGTSSMDNYQLSNTTNNEKQEEVIKAKENLTHIAEPKLTTQKDLPIESASPFEKEDQNRIVHSLQPQSKTGSINLKPQTSSGLPALGSKVTSNKLNQQDLRQAPIGVQGKTPQDIDLTSQSLQVLDPLMVSKKALSKEKDNLIVRSKINVLNLKEPSRTRSSMLSFNPLDIFLAKDLATEHDLFKIEDFMDDHLIELVPSVKEGKFALSLLASYGKYKKDYNSNEDKYLLYASSRKEFETELEILSTQLLFSFKVSDNFKLSSGLKFQRFNEQFTWSGSYFVNELGEQIDTGIDNLVGIPFYQEVDRSLNVYNKYQVLSIPVLAGVCKDYGRFSLGINLGPSFEIYSSSIGQILGWEENSENEISLPNTLESLFPEFGLGLEGSVELGLRFGRNTDLIASFSGQHLLSQEQFLTANFNSLSFGLGIRKSL